MQFIVTPKDVEKYQEFEEGVRDYPLYGHTDGLTRVEIVLLAKLLEYEFPNELTKPIKITIN